MKKYIVKYDEKRLFQYELIATSAEQAEALAASLYKQGILPPEPNLVEAESYETIIM